MNENMIQVKLTEQGLWLLYRAACCEMMVRHGLTSEVIGCDVWLYTDALDMSFEDLKDRPIDEWPTLIANDVAELKRVLVKPH